MNQNLELPNVIEIEKQLLSAMFMKKKKVVSSVLSILDADDFYRAEHKLIFRAILRLYVKGSPIDYSTVAEELRKSNEFDKISHHYLLSLIDTTDTTAKAEYYAKTIKEKAKFRKLIEVGQKLVDDAKKAVKPLAEILTGTEKTLSEMNKSLQPSESISIAPYFANSFKSEIDAMKKYVNRSTGFDNLDQQQFFNPGLYVIGATPAAGKTTFCWQLLEQLAEREEKCIYCSYEMGTLELFSKTAARKLFLRDKQTKLTAAEIRRGGWSGELDEVISEISNSQTDLQILQLQDETIDDLLTRLKPFCVDTAKAPVVCLDYLQIVPSSKETTKLGVDDSVRKLKKFQRDTNTTFIVISSFNRANYAQGVSFESFKESGNIEYTADVVWALQLNILNYVNASNISDARKRIDEAKKQQPRQIILKCLKNRHGTNYDCFFKYYSAHDCFEPCTKKDFKSDSSSDNHDDDTD